MRMYIVCVRDRAADCFGQPNFVLALGSAIRSFGDQINASDGNPFAAHPDDFDLYQLGTYDDAHAVFDLLPKPVQLQVGKDLVRKKGGV